MTVNKTIQWFADLNKSAIAVAGGKGANLGELAQTDIPVPPGFVITTRAYTTFVEANQLQPRIINLATQTQANDPATFEIASEKIRALFAQGTIPADLATEIMSTYQQLMHKNGQAVAVRSSATAEDLPEASFAGQQDTYLNIQGDEALLEAVKKCWASLWTARAIAYRLRQGIDPAEVSLAVVVQQLILADSAGILFTANPTNGQRNQILINATWGLGEAIVGGQVAPDTVVVDKLNRQILARETAVKTVMTVRTDTGTEEQPIPRMQQEQQVLDDTTALELARYGAQIEAHYAMPMDIEWAVADGNIAILQARPITALPEPTADPPTDWPMPFEHAWFIRGSIVEQMPDPLSPLFATLAPEQMSKSILNLFRELVGVGGYDDIVGFATINNYVYIYMTSKAEVWGFMARAMGAMGPLFRMGATFWRDEFRPRYRRSIAAWQAKPPHEFTAAELLAGTQELTYRGTELYTGVQMVIPLAMMSEVGFTEYYKRLVKRRSDPPAQTFLLGFDSQPIRADKSLYDLAMWSREQSTLADLLGRTRSDWAMDLLNTESPPAGVPAEVWQIWRDRFHTYLEEFGHAIYNLDFVNAVPADDPAPLFETFKFYMQGQGANPYLRQQEAIKRREEETQAVLTRLDPLRGNMFRKLLGWAQNIAPVREDALATVGLGWPLLRQLLLELGRRLTEAGAITQPNDIFWLEAAEVSQAATALDTGQTRFDSFAELIAERKMVWRGQKRATPPQILPESSKWLKQMEFIMPAGSAEQTGPVIKGVAVGSGRVTAAARVLHGPEDFAEMQPGEVLVAGITTPAWTPLFALASAVVTDIGGPMSHGSIVAREYGIPAVLGTAIATKRIKSGQQIRVDGDAGTVTLLDEVDVETLDKEDARKTGSNTKKFALAALAVGLIVGLVVWWKKRR